MVYYIGNAFNDQCSFKLFLQPELHNPLGR